MANLLLFKVTNNETRGWLIPPMGNQVGVACFLVFLFLFLNKFLSSCVSSEVSKHFLIFASNDETFLSFFHGSVFYF